MLHIANGHSLTALIERAGLDGTTAIWADALHDGPVPDVGPETLRAIRAAYLADASGSSSDRDVLLELEDWQRTVDAVDHDETVLWYEHDLFDQLNLIQLLDALRVRRPPHVMLVSINSFPGHPRFRGMGELEPADIASLFPRRQPVSEAQYGVATRAWAAFRSDDPRAIEALLAGDTRALPFLAKALRRYLEEFPSTENGLSRTEQEAISLIAAGTQTTWDVFSQMHTHEDAFFIGDLSFWTVLRHLATLQPALIELDVKNGDQTIPSGTIRLTRAGEQVLAGQADRVRLCGIDRWLGGVHVEGPAPVWRWDRAAGRLAWI